MKKSNCSSHLCPGRWFRPPEPTKTDEKWLVFRPVPDGSPVFRTASGRKSHGIMEAVFRMDSIVPGNRKIRQVPFAGFYPEARGIRAGNQSEINVSLRNLAGKVRIAAGCQPKKYRFPKDADKIIQYFLGHGKTNKKSLSKISVRLFLS